MTNSSYSNLPVAAVCDHARQLLSSRRHRDKVDGWLRTLGLDSTGDLLTDVESRTDKEGRPRDRSEATALLLHAHQAGDQVATAALIAGKARMLAAIARFAHAGTFEERFHFAVEAFLKCALAKVCPNHAFVDGQLYFITLRVVTVTARKMGRTARSEFPTGDAYFNSGDSDAYLNSDSGTDMDSYLSASPLLDWALQKGILNDLDHRALQVRYTGAAVVSVRSVAARLGVGEDALESRLRRALDRLREAAVTHRSELERACVEARWADRGVADAESEVAA